MNFDRKAKPKTSPDWRRTPLTVQDNKKACFGTFDSRRHACNSCEDMRACMSQISHSKIKMDGLDAASSEEFQSFIKKIWIHTPISNYPNTLEARVGIPSPIVKFLNLKNGDLIEVAIRRAKGERVNDV